MFAPVMSLLLAAAAATAPAATVVQLRTAMPVRCIALYQGSLKGSHVLVSADTLQTLAGGDADGLPLDARMTRIMARRASDLLAMARDLARDARGCQQLSLTQVGDAGLVLIPLIEAGRVAVWSEVRHGLVPAVRIEQGVCSLDHPVAGFSASIDGEAKAFLVLMTCMV